MRADRHTDRQKERDNKEKTINNLDFLFFLIGEGGGGRVGEISL